MKKIFYFLSFVTVMVFCQTKKQPVENTHQHANSDTVLMLTNSQMMLANVVVEKAGRRSLSETVVINGTITTDQNESGVISSRASGRIEKLFVKETGESIKKGQPLYTLYSEALLTLQQEYLLAKAQYELNKNEERYKSFLRSSERKLKLYGLTQNQIERLTDKSSAQPSITFLAPSAGVVMDVNVSEGQYVEEGFELYQLENFNKLWIEAELYPGETALMKAGDKISVRASGIESATVEATVNFMSPEYKPNSQITIMRASLDNKDMMYKPGQQVQIQLTHSAREALALPTNAIIRDGSGSHVYVKSGHNTFSPRAVTLGAETLDMIEVTAGITEKDTVAISGAYLLYSELILKRGINPMALHKH